MSGWLVRLLLCLLVCGARATSDDEEYDTTDFTTTQSLPRSTSDVTQHVTPEPKCPAGKTMENNRCIPCKIGTFKTDIGNDACKQCPYGQTTLLRGTKTKSGCLISPTVAVFSPTFGPIAGHTKVTLKVLNIEQFKVDGVKLAGVDCHLGTDEPINGMLECYTGSSNTTKYGPVEVEVMNRDDGQTQTFQSGDYYHYKPNPSITAIENDHTIVSGGIGITVHGANLYSVDRPIMRVTRMPDGKIYNIGCEVQSEKTMICYTPNLYPTESSRNQFRHRRQADPQRNGDAPGGFRHPSRCSSADIPFLSKYEFYIGFMLDGVQYVNLTDSLNIPGILHVCPDPSCKRFEKAGVKQFRPDDQERIDVKGKWFDLGARRSDVRVAIGQNYTCDVIFFVENEIGCKPPKVISSSNAKSTREISINVTVHIGKVFSCKVGLLQFRYGQNSNLSSALIVAIVLVLCAVGVAAVVMMVYIYRRRRLKQYKKRGLTRSMPPSTRTLNHFANAPSSQSARTSVVSGNSSTMLISADHLIDGRGVPLGRQESVPFNIMEYLDEDLRLHVEESSIEPDRLTMDTCIGQGHFGLVYKGFLLDRNKEKSTTVAVKTMIGSHFTLQEATSFLDEAVIMKDFRHPNVLSLLGVVIKENKPYVILPYMEFGDLKKYIGDGTRRITVRQLLALGVQVADGMCYLAEQKFVHRDLATRNCMINKSLIVKIADFGLSRDIYKSDYYRLEDKTRPLPVKWMAIESLRSGLFSTKSDVWAFGVLLWELLTRGCTPYSDVDGFLMKAYLTSGRRLAQPEYAPDDVYAVISSCWKTEPKDRPTFEDLAQTLRDIVNDRATSTHPDYLRLT